ncbi:unnamed protein product [Sympodiomycopsis kandeliae]
MTAETSTGWDDPYDEQVSANATCDKRKSPSPPPPKKADQWQYDSQPPVESSPNRSNLYVAHLSLKVTSEVLEAKFKPFGKIIRAHVVNKPYTHESRGFGFVQFQRPQDAQDAMSALNGAGIMGHPMTVTMAKRARPHSPTPGQYRGPMYSDYYTSPNQRLYPSPSASDYYQGHAQPAPGSHGYHRYSQQEYDYSYYGHSATSDSHGYHAQAYNSPEQQRYQQQQQPHGTYNSPPQYRGQECRQLRAQETIHPSRRFREYSPVGRGRGNDDNFYKGQDEYRSECKGGRYDRYGYDHGQDQDQDQGRDCGQSREGYRSGSRRSASPDQAPRHSSGLPPLRQRYDD